MLEVPPVSSTEEPRTVVGLRKLVNPVDFSNTNVTEEELKARLATFDIIAEAHTLAI